MILKSYDIRLALESGGRFTQRYRAVRPRDVREYVTARHPEWTVLWVRRSNYAGGMLVDYCRWWAMCENVGTTTRRGPIGNGEWGEVPICARCNAKVEALS